MLTGAEVVSTALLTKTCSVHILVATLLLFSYLLQENLDFSNPRFLERPDKSSHFLFPRRFEKPGFNSS